MTKGDLVKNLEIKVLGIVQWDYATTLSWQIQVQEALLLDDLFFARHFIWVWFEDGTQCAYPLTPQGVEILARFAMFV